MAELDEVLHTPSAVRVMIFDCWTPPELRGRGLYSHAIAGLAELLSAEGKERLDFQRCRQSGLGGGD